MLDRSQQPIANIALEQSLVGSVIVNPDTFRFAENIITADDFYEPIHREVWRLIADAHAAGKKIDLRLLIAALGETANHGLLGKGQSELTVKAYLARVCTEAALPMGVPDYAQAVRDLSDQRRIAALGAALWRDRPEDPDKLAIDAIDMLDHIVGARSRSHSPRVTANDAMIAAVDATAAAYQNDGVPTGIPWMIDELDHKTLGMQGGELLILAGRPGMGKSAVAISCCRQIAKRGYKTLLVSLEMSAAPIGHRLISDELYDSEKAIPYHRLRSGKVDPEEFERITRAALRMKDIPLTIEQRGGLTFSQIASMARRMKRRDGLDLLVIDHLQLIQASQRYAGQRVREVGEATAGGKMLAKELGIPVLMLCQLSRGIEGRADKRPFLSDLRESGEIEQDADVVVFVYRESYYLQNTEPKVGTEEHFKWMDAMEKAHNKCELIVAKQRNGPTGAVQIFLSVADNAVRNVVDPCRLPLDFNKME
jgi:replicative DNA helicase